MWSNFHQNHEHASISIICYINSSEHDSKFSGIHGKPLFTSFHIFDSINSHTLFLIFQYSSLYGIWKGSQLDMYEYCYNRIYFFIIKNILSLLQVEMYARCYSFGDDMKPTLKTLEEMRHLSSKDIHPHNMNMVEEQIEKAEKVSFSGLKMKYWISHVFDMSIIQRR